MTPWMTDSPVRIGVYQRDHHGSLEYSYWNGQSWNFGRKTVHEAFVQVRHSLFQDLPWRGIYGMSGIV